MDMETSKADDSLPSQIFIPIFVLLGELLFSCVIRAYEHFSDSHHVTARMTGVAIICAAIALLIIWKRNPRRLIMKHRYALPHDSTRLYVHNAFKDTGGMTKSALDELQYNLPLNHNSPTELSRSASMQERSRPNTAQSATGWSEVFRRSWKDRASSHGGSNRGSRSLFWSSRPADAAEPGPEDDLEWRPPNDWDVVGPVDGSKYIPTVPMPAFLKPTKPVDPRTIDPSSFPLPYSLSALGSRSPGRWSATTSSAHGHGRSSSVAGDSLFCTCDLEDIIEEESSGLGRIREGGGRLSTGSSIHINQGRCRACLRRSAAAAAAAGVGGHSTGQSTVPSPATAAFSRHSSLKSTRKPRRNRRPDASRRNKIAVAGRLYQESETGTPIAQS